MTILYTLIKNLPAILIGFIGVGVIIGFHELGHFIFCKIFRVKTPSFSIGFGPQLFKKRIGETEFSLSAIPFGGYVEIAGMEEVGQGEQKEASRRDHLSFNTKPYYQKMLILSGGILFNILMAYIIMVVLFSIGAPKVHLLSPDSIAPVIGKIVSGSAADINGLKEGDTILAVNHNNIQSSRDLNQIIQDKAGHDITLMIQRDGQIVHTNLTVDSVQQGDHQIGQLGIQFAPDFMAPTSFLQAIKSSFVSVNQILIKTALQYKSLFQNRLYQSVGGPIMLISEVVNSAKHGFKMFLLLLVLVSLNLAILNLIPIPILDGGQILFTTIEAIIGRSIPEKIRLGIHYICWVAAIILVLYLSYKDLFKIFNQ